jgi:hypothetical protein
MELTLRIHPAIKKLFNFVIMFIVENSINQNAEYANLIATNVIRPCTDFLFFINPRMAFSVK